MEKFPGEYGLKRVKLMLEKLGNPQEKVKVIHIAGTSGKGSTATIVAALLQAHGYKVGLHVKPHLYDIRERFQINSQLITETEFVKNADTFFSFMESVNNAGYGKMTYYEVVVSFAYYIFYQKKVDYAVVETGLGGTYDGSNVVSNQSKVCVITSIGFDHTEVLGNTIKEIASQKAGIIHRGNMVFSLSQTPEINTVMKERAASVGAAVQFVTEGKDFTKEPFSFTNNSITLQSIHLNLLGDFQRVNTAMALTAVCYVSVRDSFQLSEEKIRQTLTTISIPGRFDKISFKGKTLLLDGAHNVQKVEAFLKSLKKEYGSGTFSFLLSFKEGKDVKEMVKQIVPFAKKIVLTDFYDSTIDFVSTSVDLQLLAELIRNEGFEDITIVSHSSDSIEKIIDNTEDELLVVTGSFYLISNIYKSLRRIQSGKI